jgi:hypothetical protein
VISRNSIYNNTIEHEKRSRKMKRMLVRLSMRLCAFIWGFQIRLLSRIQIGSIVEILEGEWVSSFGTVESIEEGVRVIVNISGADQSISTNPLCVVRTNMTRLSVNPWACVELVQKTPIIKSKHSLQKGQIAWVGGKGSDGVVYPKGVAGSVRIDPNTIVIVLDKKKR